MGRRRTHIELDRAEHATAQRLALSQNNPRQVERAHFALLAATGRHTLEELAELVGRRRSTLQLWLAKFRAGGLVGLLERDAPPGSASPIAEAKVRQQLEAGLESGRWTSAADVARWLAETHGIRRSRKTIYYWFAKHGVQAPGTGHARSTN